MRLKVKPVLFGVPAVMAIVMVTVLAVWAFGGIGGAGGAAVGETAFITGTVELTHMDASGNVLFHQVKHNATTTNLLTEAAGRLGVVGFTRPLSDDDLYDNIQACSDAQSGGGCTLLDLDEEDGGVSANPLEGTGEAGVAGVYSAAVTFTCTATGDGACDAISEIQLTRDAVLDGVATGTVGFFQDVNVTLNDTDTLGVTWTVTLP